MNCIYVVTFLQITLYSPIQHTHTYTHISMSGAAVQDANLHIGSAQCLAQGHFDRVRSEPATLWCPIHTSTPLDQV